MGEYFLEFAVKRGDSAVVFTAFKQPLGLEGIGVDFYSTIPPYDGEEGPFGTSKWLDNKPCFCEGRLVLGARWGYELYAEDWERVWRKLETAWLEERGGPGLDGNNPRTGGQNEKFRRFCDPV